VQPALRRAITTTLAILAAAASAQHEDPARRSQRLIDEAARIAASQMEDAKTRQQTPSLRQTAPLWSAEALKGMKGVDPAEIARKYRDNYAVMKQQQQPTEELLVFVSTSMPPATLKRLGEQARKAGAVIVLRGFRGGLVKDALKETMGFIKPMVETGATVKVDPEAFARHDVTAVPTFVIAAREEGCAVELCAVRSFALSGDVSLEFALETWVNRGGDAGRKASAYLARIGN
jgi:conjugal transfer pilus assembly protein TrbC